MELWRPVVGFEEFYEVSNHGHVRGLARTVMRNGYPMHIQARDMRGNITVRGNYLAAMLSRNNRKKFIPIHTMVLAAFVGPRPPGTDICHIDGDKTNNRLDNLRYGSRTENMADMRRHGRLPIGDHWHRRASSRQYHKQALPAG